MNFVNPTRATMSLLPRAGVERLATRFSWVKALEDVSFDSQNDACRTRRKLLLACFGV